MIVKKMSPLGIAVFAFALMAGEGDNGEGGSFIDSRDGQKYRTVKIGKGAWMAENLNYKIGNSWCYDNDESNCIKYGRLYDWETAVKACPAGWHLPSRGEWDSLVETAGGGEVAGSTLKSKSGWLDKNNKGASGNGADDYGFSALPGGFRLYDGFYDATYFGRWWSATEFGSGYAYRRGMGGYGNVLEYGNLKGYGFSVRCVAPSLEKVSPL